MGVLILEKMKKTLQVIEPFFTAEVGDTFVLSDKTNLYECVTQQEFHKNDDKSEVMSTFNATFSLSPDYAKDLVEKGFLEEMVNEPQKSFTNVFDEINSLIVKYSDELSNLDTDMKDVPQCVKVERQTVLTNILTVLKHLNSLKK